MCSPPGFRCKLSIFWHVKPAPEMKCVANTNFSQDKDCTVLWVSIVLQTLWNKRVKKSTQIYRKEYAFVRGYKKGIKNCLKALENLCICARGPMRNH